MHHHPFLSLSISLSLSVPHLNITVYNLFVEFLCHSLAYFTFVYRDDSLIMVIPWLCDIGVIFVKNKMMRKHRHFVHSLSLYSNKSIASKISLDFSSFADIDEYVSLMKQSTLPVQQWDDGMALNSSRADFKMLSAAKLTA